MSSFALLTLLLLLQISLLEAVIQCLVSTRAEFGNPSHPVPGECYQNWCKRVVGGTGVVEYSCDQQGDCANNANNDPYDPYVTEIRNCWSHNGRQVCCCNVDYCNGSSMPILWILLAFIGIYTLM